VGLTKQEIEEQIIHEKDLIRELVRRKRVLEIQAAQTGNNVRPEVLTEIGDLTNKIHAHEEELVRLESLPVTVKQLRVLYVEDVEHYAEQYMKVLQAHFGVDQVKHVKTAKRALAELNDRPPDVLVADLHIPAGPGYVIPPETAGLPRIGGDYAYGADICAVALHRGIPVVALSTAPVRHPVREPIEQSRRKYGGTVYHLYKNNFPDKTQLISSVVQSYEALSEVEQISKELRYWVEEQWLDAPDISARLAILNVVQMALENASQPTRATIQTSPIGEIIQNLLKTHSPGSEEERVILEAIEQLLSDDTSDFTDKSLAPG
jgi:CheY-like chemotaxis protein